MPPNPNARGSGNTTKQVLEAPDGATFVWVNDDIGYPRRLFEKFKDSKQLPMTQRLFIVPRSLLSQQYAFRGIGGPVILDHAIIMTPRECEVYRDFIEHINQRYHRDQKVVEL